MTSSFIVYIAVGKLLLFFSQKFAKDNGIIDGLIGRLLNCGLCLGFWIYTALSSVLEIYVFEDLYSQDLIMATITGAFTSFIVYVFSAGWDSLFSVISIE